MDEYQIIINKEQIFDLIRDGEVSQIVEGSEGKIKETIRILELI